MKKLGKILLVIICIVAVVAAIGGGYYAKVTGWFNTYNGSQYSAKKATTYDSHIKGRKVIFLGSSVTDGYGAKGESFVDYLHYQDGVYVVKKAVSGTTLCDDKSNSYVSRIKKINESRVSAFVCQLSTNDATLGKPLGNIVGPKDEFNASDYDTHTVCGAVEYIIGYAKEKWDCPIIFYTNTHYESEEYEAMVKALNTIRKQWKITVIDLYNNKEMTEITDEEKAMFMNDDIHPTRLGYRDWWTPKFRDVLLELIPEEEEFEEETSVSDPSAVSESSSAVSESSSAVSESTVSVSTSEASGSTTYYWTETGDRYHMTKSCNGLANANDIYEGETYPAGLTPCQICC